MKTFTITKDALFDDKAVLGEVARFPSDPQRGMSVDEVRMSCRVLDALERGTDTVTMEDADYEHLKAKLNSHRWRIADPKIVAMVDRVLAAESSVA